MSLVPDSPARPSLSHDGVEAGLSLDICHFIHALRLGIRAQGLTRGRPLAVVASRMLTTPLLPRHLSITQAVRATRRASWRLGRWLGHLDSCLVSSLVAGSLLADRPQVVLHLGFFTSDDSPLSGHAWLTVEGEVVPGLTGKDPPGRPWEEAAALPLSRDTV